MSLSAAGIAPAPIANQVGLFTAVGGLSVLYDMGMTICLREMIQEEEFPTAIAVRQELRRRSPHNSVTAAFDRAHPGSDEAALRAGQTKYGPIPPAEKITRNALKQLGLGIDLTPPASAGSAVAATAAAPAAAPAEKEWTTEKVAALFQRNPDSHPPTLYEKVIEAAAYSIVERDSVPPPAAAPTAASSTPTARVGPARIGRMEDDISEPASFFDNLVDTPPVVAPARRSVYAQPTAVATTTRTTVAEPRAQATQAPKYRTRRNAYGDEVIVEDYK